MSRETVSKVVTKCDICKTECKPRKEFIINIKGPGGVSQGSVKFTVSTVGIETTFHDVCDGCLQYTLGSALERLKCGTL